MNLRFLLPALCLAMSSLNHAASITSEVWGKTASGDEVTLFTLRNASGMEARIMNYGGILVSLKTADKSGKVADVVLGFDSLAPYLEKNPFFGCITGRYANRIGGAAFSIDGTEYKVTANSGANHIHGGKVGFDKKVWQATPRLLADGVALALKYSSAAGEEGFPGKLDCTVTYTLNDRNELTFDYQAESDAPTVVNLTNHSYFNLAGEGSGPILDHELQINATTFTPTDDDLITTGELASIAGTPLDFSTPHRIGERIDADYKPLIQGLGYDHNFVVPGSGMRSAAVVHDPVSGRTMEVLTTEPGIQLYTANHLKDVHGKNGHVYQTRHALCLETQHYPDSPNKANFPSTVLRPGQSYHTTTVLRFSAR